MRVPEDLLLYKEVTLSEILRLIGAADWSERGVRVLDVVNRGTRQAQVRFPNGTCLTVPRWRSRTPEDNKALAVRFYFELNT